MSDDSSTREDFKEIPETMPVIPLIGTMIYPFMVVPYFVQGENNEKAVDAAMENDHYIFAASVRNSSSSNKTPAKEDLFEVGAVASIIRLMRVPSGGIKILAQGLFRAKASSLTDHPSGFITANVELIEESPVEPSPELEALIRIVREQVRRAVNLGKPLPEEFVLMINKMGEPGKLADLISSAFDLSPEESQSALEEFDPQKRLAFVSKAITRELEILEIQNKIKTNVQSEMEDNQKKYVLKEQLKAIQKELGQDDPRKSEIDELRRAISEAKMSDTAEKQSLKELERLERMHPDAAEANVIRTYIDWMLALPWNKSTKDRIDLDRARKILDADHYGLEKVKDRIIEALAVRKLKPDARSPIICFVGPPGVGKTSLGQSIARAIGRSFVRFSVGGVRDEAEIRGHRRTYVGALPGRIVNGLKTAGSKNPVFMIDEIDKIGSDYRGDPSSALLEVLDPEQNNSFADHYLDVPFDLSQVMFITTANILDTIPGPLRDRMEVIHIHGYTEDEKLNIAVRYLIPRQCEASGLDNKKVRFLKHAVQSIIGGYTREAGVRNLEREIGKICRKIATRVAKGSRIKSFTVAASDVVKYLGPPRAEISSRRKRDQIGVVNGLAWTPSGGETLTIEAIVMDGKGKLTLTGQLGDIMKESAQAALSYARSRANDFGFAPDNVDKKDIHIHVPAGAIPKDGPSAGVAMFTALLSAFTRKPVRRDVAMTGEISLRGAVLPIGGLKQKLLAARREGIKTVLVPLSNKNDISDMDSRDIGYLEIKYLEFVDDILPYVFRDGGAKTAKTAKTEVKKKASALKSKKTKN
ncbi:MAG TPA: endopeptidase La [bacterium]|nr:endopeptidase La [bacterium]